MTATSDELTAARPSLLEVVRSSMSRSEFFAGLCILGCANGLLGRALLSLSYDGWAGVLLALDINVIVLFACFAGIGLLLRSGDREQIQAADIAVAIVFLILVALPIFALSWVALTGLSLYILLFARGDSSRKRGAFILLALTVPMLWSRLLFQLFALPILKIDASLVAFLLGTERTGNMVRFADASGYMVVLAPCSSLANMSLAFLCWITITQWANHRWCAMDIVWSLLACLSVIAVNVGRISLMGLSYGHHQMIHGQWGDLVTNSLILGLTVGFSLLGARRELFSRA
jgi:hypothetical protein